MSDDRDKKKSDFLKKMITTGIGAAFTTEETIRNIMNEIPERKEALNNLLQNAKNTKEEVINSVRAEVKKFLGGVDITKEVERVVENYDIEVNATFKFKPKRPKSKKVSKKKARS